MLRSFENEELVGYVIDVKKLKVVNTYKQGVYLSNPYRDEIFMISRNGEVRTIDSNRLGTSIPQSKPSFVLPLELSRATLFGDDGYFYAVVGSGRVTEIVRASAGDRVAESIFQADSSFLKLIAFQGGHLIFHCNGSLFAAPASNIKNAVVILNVGSQALMQKDNADQLIFHDSDGADTVDLKSGSTTHLDLPECYPGFTAKDGGLLVGIPGRGRNLLIHHDLKALDLNTGRSQVFRLGKGSISELNFESVQGILAVGKSDGELSLWRVK